MRGLPAGDIARLGKNALSLLASEVLNRASTFAVYALVARQFGAEDFGRLSLALVVLQALQLLVSAGLRTVIARDVARDQNRTSVITANGLLLALGNSVVAIAGLALVLPLLDYDSTTRAAVMLMAIGVAPLGLATVAEGILQGLERMHLIALSNTVSNVLKIVVVALLVGTSVSLLVIIAILVASHGIAAAVSVGAVSRQPEFTYERPRLVHIKALFTETLTFLAMEAIRASLNSIDVIAVSVVAGAAAVALVSAAMQVLVPVSLLFQTASLACFPVMCRLGGSNARLRRFSSSLLELLMLVVMPTALVTALYAGPLLSVVYGEREFSEAADLLRIVVWVLLIRTITHVLGMGLLATNRERLTLRIMTITGLVALVLSPLLVGLFGVTGAALSVTAVRVVSLVQHLWATREIAGPYFLPKAMCIPASASAAMAGALLVTSSMPLGISIALGVLVFLSAAVLLEAWAAGGLGRIQDRLLMPLRPTELDTASTPLRDAAA